MLQRRRKKNCISGPLVANSTQHFIHLWSEYVQLKCCVTCGVYLSVIKRPLNVILSPRGFGLSSFKNAALPPTNPQNFRISFFLDSHPLHAFAEWVTPSTTDCVWSAKWAGDSATASLCPVAALAKQHAALARELSFFFAQLVVPLIKRVFANCVWDLISACHSNITHKLIRTHQQRESALL